MFDKVREGKHGVLRAEDQNLPPREHRATEEYIRGIFVDPRHRWGAGESTTETQSGFFLIVEYALDGETGGARPNPKSCSRTKAEISICRAAH